MDIHSKKNVKAVSIIQPIPEEEEEKGKSK